MKKSVIIVAIVVSGFMLGGCGVTGTKTGVKSEEKQNFTVTKSGTLKMKAGEDYLLQTEEVIVNVNSTKVNLDQYIGKKVEVKGMYSGSTLYADEVK